MVWLALNTTNSLCMNVLTCKHLTNNQTTKNGAALFTLLCSTCSSSALHQLFIIICCCSDQQHGVLAVKRHQWNDQSALSVWGDETHPFLLEQVRHESSWMFNVSEQLTQLILDQRSWTCVCVCVWPSDDQLDSSSTFLFDISPLKCWLSHWLNTFDTFLIEFK